MIHNGNHKLFFLCSYDIVVDCTDNVATRYLLNDCCVFLNKTLVSGSALRFEGQVIQMLLLLLLLLLLQHLLVPVLHVVNCLPLQGWSLL